MRKLLLSAAAAAPLLLFGAGFALADTTVGSTTSEVQTSKANAGAPDNVIIGAGATVSVAGPLAVTMDSSNNLTNNGTISISNQDNSTAVLLNGGNTGAFVNAGTITNTETYTRTDTNKDGVLDGPLAQGTNRYGVHLAGAAPLIGTLQISSGSSISVQGNNSFGIALDAALQGDLQLLGSVGVAGDNSTGLSITAPISGKVFISGPLNGTGAGTTGVNIAAPIGGSLSIYSSVASTGYSVTTRNPDPTVNANLLPSDLLTSNSALQIGNNVQGGVFLGAPPSGTSPTDATTDADGDGIIDSIETVGSVTTFGTAPALSIGSSVNDVHLGAYGTGTNGYGLILEGNVTGSGVFDTFSGTGVQIGAPGGHLVTIDGGIHIAKSGTVGATAFQANATGIHILSGVTVPTLLNDGTLSVGSSTALASQATALQIEAGASLASLANNGTINAAITGDLGSATAILDLSGHLASVTNTNAITAGITPAISTDTTTGKTVAIDLSHNTTGVTLVQNPNTSPTTITTSTGVIITIPAIVPAINGDILLGSGNDTVQFNAGRVTGTLDFGQGSGSVLIDGGAVYTGRLQATGSVGSLALNVNNGTLVDSNPNGLNLGSLTVGAAGQLTVSVDPAHNTATHFVVSGPVNLVSGAKLNVQLLSIISGTQSYDVITSAPGALTVGSAATLTATTPFLFVAQFNPDLTTGTVSLDVRRRLASEAGLNRAETAAWDPVYQNLGLNSGIQRAFLSQTDAAGYRSMLSQILPDYAGGVFRALSWANEQQGVAAGDPPLGQDQNGPTRAWTQEIVLDETKKTAQTEPYHLLGVGMVAGLESVSPKGDALGMKIGFVTANVANPDAPGDNLLGVSELNGGIYWRGNFGALKADAQLGAGFIWANDRREFLYSDSVGVVHATALSSWSGYTLSGRAGLSYTATMGAFFLEPRVHADYFRLHQAGYSETGGGTGFDMKVNARNGDLLSVTGSVIAGMTFGNTGFRWRPQIEVGYRTVLAGSAGSTTTEFIGGTDPFTLAAETVRTNSAIGRVGLRIYSDYIDVLLDGGAAISSDYTDIDVHLTARTVF